MLSDPNAAKLTSVSIFVVALLSACTDSPHPPSTMHDRTAVDVVLDHQTGASYIIHDNTGLEQVCASAGPDVVTGSSRSGEVSRPSIEGEKSISHSRTFSADNLGGRSPAVLITREMLYRACELTVNQRLSKSEAVKLFEFVVNKSSEIAKTEGQTVDTFDEVQVSE